MSKQTGESAETEARTDEPERRDDHLQDVPDGCGCVEVWEHLSDDAE
ncbi:hypothetical protein [Haloarcula litorea]|nr:hypothetical protein [Halomicroarcula sp. GDY20]